MMLHTKILSLAALALSLQACVVELGDHHRGSTRPNRPGKLIPDDRRPAEWGESCHTTSQCAYGLHCMDFVCEPERIGIYPEGALIAPGRSDGMEWDEDFYFPRWVWEELAISRREGANSLFSYMDELSYLGFSMPDPYGYGFLATERGYEDRYTVALAERGELRDVFHARWQQPVGWTDVPFTNRLSVAFDLYDRDGYEDEEIGIVEFDYRLLRQALYQGGVVWFDTWDETDGQLLLFGLRVVPES